MPIFFDNGVAKRSIPIGRHVAAQANLGTQCSGSRLRREVPAGAKVGHRQGATRQHAKAKRDIVRNPCVRSQRKQVRQAGFQILAHGFQIKL